MNEGLLDGVSPQLKQAYGFIIKHKEIALNIYDRLYVDLRSMYTNVNKDSSSIVVYMEDNSNISERADNIYNMIIDIFTDMTESYNKMVPDNIYVDMIFNIEKIANRCIKISINI